MFPLRVKKRRFPRGEKARDGRTDASATHETPRTREGHNLGNWSQSRRRALLPLFHFCAAAAAAAAAAKVIATDDGHCTGGADEGRLPGASLSLPFSSRRAARRGGRHYLFIAVECITDYTTVVHARRERVEAWKVRQCSGSSYFSFLILHLGGVP